MTSDQLLMAEVFINIAAALAVLAALAKILFGPSRSLVQNRLALILSNLGAIAALRAIDYSMGLPPTLKIIMFCLTATIPLAALLMAEGLLRRHAPLGLKIMAVGGALLHITWAIVGEPNPIFFGSLGIFEIIMFSGIVWIVTHSAPNSVSDSEQRILRSIGLVLLICLPLVLTNLREVFNWPVPRLGAIAILLLTVTMVKLTEKLRRREVLFEIAFIFVIDLIGALVFCLVWGKIALLPLVYPVCVAFHLFIIAVKELLLGNQDQVQDWVLRLIEEIDHTKSFDLSEIKRRAQEVINSQSLLILSEEDLKDFDLVPLRAELSTGQISAAGKNKGEELSVSQAAYLLESYQMTVIHTVSFNPLILILVNNRSLGFSSTYSKEITLLRGYLSALMRNPT